LPGKKTALFTKNREINHICKGIDFQLNISIKQTQFLQTKLLSLTI